MSWIDLGFDLAGRPEPRLRRGLAWSVAAALFESLPYACLYGALRRLTVRPPDLGLAAACAGILLACALLLILCKARANIANFGGVYALVADSRLRLADHLSALPMGRLAGQGRSQAGLAELLTGRYAHYQDITARAWGLSVANASLPVFLWLLLCAIDIRLALLAGVLGPLAFCAIPWSQRLLSGAHARLAGLREDTVAHVVEHIAGMRELRLYDPASRHLRRTLGLLRTLETQQMRTELAPAPALLVFGALLQAGLAVTAVAGAAWLAPGPGLAANDGNGGLALLAGLVVALRLFRALADLGLNLAELRHARDTLRDIRRLWAEPALPWPADGAAVATPALGFEHVSYRHPGMIRPAVDDVGGEIPAGSVVALVGPSGSGKSTLAALIARMWDPASGAIRLGGQDLRDLSPACLNRQVSTVLQDVMLFQGSIAENIALGAPEASRTRIEEAARAARAHAFIEALPQGYDTRLPPGGAGLSGGEKQRLAIARALVKDSPLLILDEATASMDPENEWEIKQALDSLTRDRTVIVIAHRLHTVRHADAIWVMEHGRIVERGRHAELIARAGLYARLWSRQREQDGTH
ncbi:hypothetical protein CAL29_20790 [Bordetella genomosp. 10]|uniref:ABC transporter ATP-binding protein n=1 Tax=Bordetella genomosp. 10 TaxID=1416804 RepID=A0A261RZE6_9BORD|nr:ABC transporter ATP-binding protein [Bordetella genomosp. 10]OZI30466.1 hypothetical protein CAL29_20790 [Bordetella genomosp. 10]